MAEGQQHQAQPPAEGGGAGTAAVKRAAPNALTSARGKLAKAQQEQLDADARMQEVNERVQTRSAGVVKGLRKERFNKLYQTAWTKVQVAMRERLCEESTRIATRKELDDLLAGRRPPGSITYLFRWCLKRSADPIEEMLIIECVLKSNREVDAVTLPTFEQLEGELFLEYGGVRTVFNELVSIRTLVNYAYRSEDGAQGNALTDDQLSLLCNDVLMHLTQDVIQMCEVLTQSSSQEFVYIPNLYYQMILSQTRTIKAQSLLHPHH
jgi:hypothetical protein